jgi:IclR family acetate operon transcriptional repressor
MPVKRSHSGARILVVLETIASHQPIGVRALARLLNEDPSAIQRAIMTLADEGWIRTSSEPPTRWEVTAHILAVAHAAQGSNDLRRRARPLLERLRDESGETVLLVVPDVKNLVIADVIESRHMLRMVPHVGLPVSARNTASGRAMLPFMDIEAQSALLGAKPDKSLLKSFEMIRQRGYSVSDGEIDPVVTNVAAPIFEFDGAPAGAIVVCGPRDRLTPSLHDVIGKMIVRTAAELSLRSVGALKTPVDRPADIPRRTIRRTGVLPDVPPSPQARRAARAQ